MNVKRLLVYMKGYGRECVLGPLFKLLEASFELIVPLIVAAIIDRGILAGDRGAVIGLVGWLAVLGLVGLVSAVTAQYFAAKAAIGFSTRVRHALMEKIQTLSFAQIDKMTTSTLVTRMTSDVTQVQTGVNMTLRLLLRSPFVVFGAMVMAFTIDFGSALIFAAVIAALCVIVFGIMLVTIPMYRNVQGQLDSVTAATRENLHGVRVIRAFCREGAEEARFEKRNQLLTRLQLAVGRVSGAMNPVTYVVINAAVIVLIHTGALRVEAGSLTQGEVVALYNYMSQILVELVKMANLIILLTKAAACGERIAKVMDVRPEQLSGAKTPAADAPKGSVVFEGKDTREMDLDIYRREHAAVIYQNFALFPLLTVAENIMYPMELRGMRAKKAKARAAELVEKVGLPASSLNRYPTMLSGGEQQRVAIARALGMNTKILLADEPTGNLDTANSENIFAILQSLAHDDGYCVVIVTHDLALADQADRVLELRDGTVKA